MRLVLVFSHALTEAQKKDAMENHRVYEFVSLPSDLQNLWSNVPADTALDIKKYLSPISQHINDNFSPRKDIILVAGDFGATYSLVSDLMLVNFTCVYATTKREVKEVVQVDGSILKTSVFNHVGFRQYK